MPTEADFLQQLQANPDDRLLRQIFADWLEEQNDPRGGLLRLTEILTRSLDVPDRPRLEYRLQELLDQGIQPLGPYWTNGLGMRFAWIPAGVYLMGSPQEEIGRGFDETQQPVAFSRGFYLGVYPVTQAEWHGVMSTNPSHFQGQEDLPVETVSWHDCQEFLSALRKRDGNNYRLPTEAEWEYACRAGTTTPFSFGSIISGERANYNCHYVYSSEISAQPLQKTNPVGTFAANAFGIFDMHGNVWEWCQDLDTDIFRVDSHDPKDSDSGFARVFRGGCWFNRPEACRSAQRHRNEPSGRNYGFGLRVLASRPAGGYFGTHL